MEARVRVLEGIAGATKAAIERFDRRFEGIEAELRSMRAEHRADFRWVIGLGLGTAGALLAAMAHGFHWI